LLDNSIRYHSMILPAHERAVRVGTRGMLISKAHSTMRTCGAFIASVVVAFVVLSVFADSGRSTQRVATGTVAEFHTGEWMVVTNTGMRLPVALRETTAYEGNPADIKPGIRVTVWYRGVAERRPVADKVRMHADAQAP